MNDKPEPVNPDTPVVGDEARRRFVKNSGGMALAAPAVVLLLSAHSKQAAAGQYGPPNPTPKGPRKTLLDP